MVQTNDRKLKALGLSRNNPNLEYVWEENQELCIYGFDGFLFLVVTVNELNELQKQYKPYWYDIQEEPVAVDGHTFLICGVDDYDSALETLQQLEMSYI